MLDNSENNNINNQDNKNENVVQDQSQDQNIEQQCQQELLNLKKQYMYLVAEFDNFKKRSEKEISQSLHYGEFLVLKDLLSILDNFERAFHQIEAEVKSGNLPQASEKHLEGFKLILKSFEKVLSKYHVNEVSYEEFNPELHEAIMQSESGQHKSGEIVQVLEKGYLHKAKLLRPAKVCVAK